MPRFDDVLDAITWVHTDRQVQEFVEKFPDDRRLRGAADRRRRGEREVAAWQGVLAHDVLLGCIEVRVEPAGDL